MKKTVYCLVLFTFMSIHCIGQNSATQIKVSDKPTNGLPYLTYQKENLFPGNGSLLRAEDGAALKDGRIVVVDQAKGLRLIEKDGSNRPFGNFADAGFSLDSSENTTAPNGINLEPDGKHLLMCDVASGKIYRTNIASEKVTLIYDHPYGINSIYRDKTGAIWFTQSMKNTTLEELWDPIKNLLPNGAIYRMAGLNSIPNKIAEGLVCANGIVMDKAEKQLFVAETGRHRVHSFDVDSSSGKTKYSGVVASVQYPDNILIDTKGRLIVALVLNYQVVAVDLENHSQHIIFEGATKENLEISSDYKSLLPGFLTGMFFSADGKTLYIANLGNDLLKYDFK
ncbi:MAG: sugar lactone lactonase YvrE [Arenicella sp.]|jgi:sugar lactone lactonase YvrE